MAEMELATVDVFLWPEGAMPNPRLYWSVPESEAVEMLGLSNRLKYSGGPPSFNVGLPARLDGYRGSRFAVARIDYITAKTLKLKEGYYLLKKSVDDIKALKASQTARAA
jgi:hypothetical protein